MPETTQNKDSWTGQLHLEALCLSSLWQKCLKIGSSAETDSPEGIQAVVCTKPGIQADMAIGVSIHVPPDSTAPFVRADLRGTRLLHVPSLRQSPPPLGNRQIYAQGWRS